MATPKKGDAPETKPAEISPARLFEKLGAPLFANWSTGAMHPDGTVYLIAGKDGVLYKRGEEEQSKTDSERLMHIQRIRAGHPCVLVIGEQLFATGELSEADGAVVIEVGDPVPEPETQAEPE